MNHEEFRLETQLIHAHANGSPDVTPPIYQASTFPFEDAESMALASATPGFERFYTRYGNPNHGQVERVVAAIEGGEAAMVSASGMGAISSTAIALTKAGDHVVAQSVIYDGTRRLLSDVLARFGVDVTYVDQGDPQAFADAMRPNTSLVMLETPSNPMLGITDLAAVEEIAHGRGALVTVDNTIATPINQNPLALGADVVLHSATKYLGGHSDLIAGVAVGSRELIDRIWETHHIVGATLGPFEAWLLLRGLRTLEMRVTRHNGNALELARFLHGHPRVTTVYYPGLETHPQHELAKRQMRGFGGLLSFEIDGTFEDARRVIDRLRLVHSAVSLGGVESLIAQPGAMWSGRAQTSSSLRVSVGIESIQDLVEDFEQALV